MKKISFLTSSRADFGTFHNLILEFTKKKTVCSNIIVLGKHTEKKNLEYHLKIKKLSQKKNVLIKKINLNNKNLSKKDINQSFSQTINLMGNYINKSNPNVLVVFGDRFEMFAGAISAYVMRIPIVHIAGGEVSAGSIDDSFRHSITKLSSLHFPTSNNHKKRIIQLGEKPNTVFNFGSLNHEKIVKNEYIDKVNLEKRLNIKFKKKNFIVTYHPETIDENLTIENMRIILLALKSIKDSQIIITSPNKDAKGLLLERFIVKFLKQKKLKNFKYFQTLGSEVYLSLLKQVDGVIGNSSSGLSEAPLFGVGTVNIGDRQLGRTTKNSVINCKPLKNQIIRSINKITSKNFKKKIFKNTIFNKKNYIISKMIMKKILNHNFKINNKKLFHDIFFK